MKRYIKVIILLLFILTSCQLIDTKTMTETTSPRLKRAPINGVWEVSNIIKSDSRFSYNLKDKFVFNIDLVASDKNLYLNPEYEVQHISWKRYLEEKERWLDLDKLIQKEYVDMIQVSHEDQVIADLIPIGGNIAIGIMNNQLVELRRIQDTIDSQEKNDLILKYSEKERQNRSENTWGLALGIKEFKYDEQNNLPQYEYRTILFDYSPQGLRVDNIEGLLVNYQGQIDHYMLVREDEGGLVKDKILLNGIERPIIDHNNSFQSNIFSINFLSSSYLTIEYYQGYKSLLNSLSTYSTRTKKGFVQLKSDDLISFSSDKILETINKTKSELSYEEAIYNISLNKENGLEVLKARLVTEKDTETLVQDYLLSNSFTDSSLDKKKIIYFEKLKARFPDIVDFYLTPNDTHVIIIRGDKISVYKIDGFQDYSLIYSEDISPNNKVISTSDINPREMREIRIEYQRNQGR